MRVQQLVPPLHPVHVLARDAGDVVEDEALDALRQEPVKLRPESLVKLWISEGSAFAEGLSEDCFA